MEEQAVVSLLVLVELMALKVVHEQFKLQKLLVQQVNQV